MRPLTQPKWLAIFLFCTAAVLSCGREPTAPHPFVPNFIRLRSDPGDWVGSGKYYEYTQANSIITVNTSDGWLHVWVSGEEGWQGAFRLNTSGRLEHGSGVGAFSWYGANVCNTIDGWFFVDTATYQDTALTALDLQFEQHCGTAAGGLHGTIHWRAEDPTRPPGPVNPVPADLWKPAAGATPASGNYVYLTSDGHGDWVGQGQTWVYTPANAFFGVTSGSGLFSVNLVASPSWYGEFKAMSSVPDKLLVGYYGDLGRYPFNNPTKGGFDWFGDGRGCNSLRGWFAIDHIEYAADTLKAFDLRFEQHCEEVPPALHGAIHWVR